MPPIIEVQNLSKKYKIGATQPRYLSLRDSLSSTFKGIKNWTNFNKSSNSDSVDNTEFWALKDINFTVNAGESIGIIGRNGAGKSTLLKILSRITPPTSGTAILRGRLASLLEVGTGFHPELSGRENVYFNGSILGLKKAEIDRKFDEIVDFSGVERFIDTPLKNYSSGMQLRLAFAVAAHLEPEILIIDEVLAVGDSIFQQKCMEKMTQMSQEQNRTILFVSHNLLAIKQLSKKVILLEQGGITMTGEAQEVIDFYNQYKIAKGKKIDLSDIRRSEYAGHLIFEKIEFATPIFEFGAPISFQLTLLKTIPDCIDFDIEFGVVIDNQDGYCMIHLSNIFINKSINFPASVNRASYEFNIDSCSLRSGKYRIRLFLRANNIIQDWLFNVAEFEIAEGNFYNFNNSSMIAGTLMPKFTLDYVGIGINPSFKIELK